MKLKLRDRQITVTPTDEEYFTSPFTGDRLKKVQVSISVMEQQSSDFEDILDFIKNHGISEIDEAGKELKKYEIINTSYTYSNYPRDIEYTFQLSEEESLKINKLVIEDIEFSPYEYQEILDGEAIIINAKVKVTKDIAGRIENLENNGGQYFNVIREGINKNPIKMRFGQNIWSEHDDTVKFLLTIVEDKYDTEKDDEWRPPGYPRDQNAQSMTLYHETYIKLLNDLLVEKGILNKVEIEELSKTANEMKNKNRKYLNKVSDVDQEKFIL